MNTEYYIKRGIFLQGNVPSLKNSKEIQTYRKWVADPIDSNSRILREFKRLGSSKTVNNYIKNYGYVYIQNRVDIQNIFRGHKIWKMGLYFVRNSLHRFDFINATQIIQDLMVQYNYIDDDNIDYIQPVCLGYHYDKDNPGVYIINVYDLYSLDYILSDLKNKLENIDNNLSSEIPNLFYCINYIENILLNINKQ